MDHEFFETPIFRLRVSSFPLGEIIGASATSRILRTFNMQLSGSASKVILRLNLSHFASKSNGFATQQDRPLAL
jgi:hypothetical protein